MSTPSYTVGTPPPGVAPPQSPRRRPLRTIAVVGAALVVAAGAANLAGLLFRQSQTRTFTYPAAGRLDVDVDSGAVDVVAGGPGSTTVRRTLTWSFSRPSTSQRLVGDRLVLRSGCGAVNLGLGCSGRYRITVPPGTNIVAHSDAGSVSVTGTSGDVHASSSAGGVHVRDVSGRLTLSSSAGGVSGTGLGSRSVDAHSSAGGVELSFDRPPTSVSARSSAGGVDVHLPRTPDTYQVDAGSSAGSTHIEVATDPASTRTLVARSSAGGVTVDYLR